MGHSFVLYNAELNETMGWVEGKQFLVIFKQFEVFEYCHQDSNTIFVFEYSNIRLQPCSRHSDLGF